MLVTCFHRIILEFLKSWVNEQQIAPYLKKSISLAINNGNSCVVAGGTRPTCRLKNNTAKTTTFFYLGE